MSRSSSAPAKYNLAAAADGAVSRFSTAGYGTSAWLPLRGWSTERAYLRFEMPSPLEVQSARLRLCVLTVKNATLNVFVTSDNWEEHTLTFAGAPRVGRLIGRIQLRAGGPRCAAVNLRGSSFSGRSVASVVVTTNVKQRLYLAARERPALQPLLKIVGSPAVTPATTVEETTTAILPATTRPAATPPPAGSAPTTTAATTPPTTTVAATTTALVTTTVRTTTTPVTTTAPVTTTTPGGGTVVIAAAGDVACDPADRSFNGGLGTATACREARTANIVESIDPVVVLGLGDMQYEDGAYEKYRVSYDKSWGEFRGITYATPGGSHHGFATATSGYCLYFGSHACPNGKTYFSFDAGTWHIVSLDANCTQVGGCQAGSAEEQWLRADLAAHHNRCTIAMWHFPRWTIGEFSDDPRTDAFVRDLYSAGADLILTGHDHLYERFAPQTPDGVAAASGIREFVVGTGGKNHLPGQYSVNSAHPNLQAWNEDTFGILKLTLRPTSYDWTFVPDSGSPGSFTDSGSADCH
ncbi:MAG: CBM96 family carbohydrate-binding protein [Gaiellaceae bacterium]